MMVYRDLSLVLSSFISFAGLSAVDVNKGYVWFHVNVVITLLRFAFYYQLYKITKYTSVVEGEGP